MSWISYLSNFFATGFLVYSVVLISFYIFIAAFAIAELRKHFRINSFTDYRVLAASSHAPGISVIAPAYNEGANIIENVRSLLSIHYNNLELIIVNDGSKDDSLDKLIKGYDLYKTAYFVNPKIATKPIRGIYKSRNPVFNKLMVVDKENGGKADALNVGVNVSSRDYVVCIDADCVLEQDALLKMAKPFLESNKERVIASGGVIRIANDCVIEGGRLVKVNLPKNFLARAQTLEYIRSFLLGRMAWSRMNGLLLISGAFGAFDKDILIKCGGYNNKTVGEDMELVVRMRRYMEENKLPYKVTYIPDPLCWTEAPDNYKILGRQRNRWTRGTIETLWMHRKIFFNPRYGLLGMLSYPYWFFFEFLAPIIEFLGIIGFIIFGFLGLVQWHSFFTLLVCVLSFGFLYSVFAILMEVLTYNQYKKNKDIFKLFLTAILEPFLFHPFVVWSAIMGNVDYLRNKNSWGEMVRKGLSSTTPPQNATAAITLTVQEEVIKIVKSDEDKIPDILSIILNDKEKKQSSFSSHRLLQGIKEAAVYSIILPICMLIVKVYELIRDAHQFGVSKDFFKVIKFGIINDISFGVNFVIFPVAVFIILFYIHKKVARFFFIIFSLLLITVHSALSEYFLKSVVPLGADLLNYSFADIKQTVGSAGISTTFISSIIILLSFVTWLFIIIPKKLQFNTRLSIIIISLFSIGSISSIASITNSWKPGEEFSNNLSLNKSYYFYNSCYKFLSHSKLEDIITAATISSTDISAFRYVDEKHYPFLHLVDTSTDVLSPFFNKQQNPPNIVFIVVEGLGRAFSNKNAYLGSFTPFLDSLSVKSLYWSNFLSAGGRTFAMLPSILGSLPFGKNGFAEMGDNMPSHLSLLNILKHNGYGSNFFYGGNASFDNMDKFLKMNGANIYDQKTFSSKYNKMQSANGFSWGYGDEETFKKVNDETVEIKKPSCNIVLTLSTHNPFLINEEDKYLQLFEERMNTLKFDESQKQDHRHYKNQYASILYADNAIRNFIKNYSDKNDFNNTIFIITGDHRMPEIPMSTKIDRYHVPLIIYSPLLKRSQTFEAMSSHLDITPSLLALLHYNNNLEIPKVATWLGKGLDTAHSFRNINAYPLMQTKNDLVDYLMNDYLLNGDDLYKISNNMNAELVIDANQKAKMKRAFAIFKEKNNKLANTASLLPDSLLIKN